MKTTYKPGSVWDNHSSRCVVTNALKRPTRTQRERTPVEFLFGLAPDGVYPATHCYQGRGALLPHHFTLTRRRYIFCGTFRGLTPPRHYLASRSMEPGLSSRLAASDCPVVFGADNGSVAVFIQELNAFKQVAAIAAGDLGRHFRGL